VAETEMMGISSPDKILTYCDWVFGKGGSYQTPKTGSQPGQKVMLQTACPEKCLRQMNENRQQ
jgi:hypothetical protein